MTPLPLTVISGYLGAGKTTLINRILTEAHGLKLMVMVNDFGAINIDADLLVSADEDTLTLTNGCVCCTMGADLFMALGDVLDRQPRPDHLILEASGIADPGRIAAAAIAEPELAYGGIVTVVDGEAFERLRTDAKIGVQVTEQVGQADLIVVSKINTVPRDLRAHLAAISAAPILLSGDALPVSDLLLKTGEPAAPQKTAPHPAYVAWSHEDRRMRSREELTALLEQRPAGAFRLKGFVLAKNNHGWDVQVVGQHASFKKCAAPEQTRIVGIGLAQELSAEALDHWWTA